MDLDSEYFVGILEKYSNGILNEREKKIVFFCEKIRELMEFLRETSDKYFVKNALVIMLALFGE